MYLSDLGYAEYDHGVCVDYDQFGAFFVDSSGFESSSEPALTLTQLAAEINKITAKRPGTSGFATITLGQFQVYVSVFKKR